MSKFTSFAEWENNQCFDFFNTIGLDNYGVSALYASMKEAHMYYNSGGDFHCKYNSPFAVYTRRNGNRTVVQIISLRHPKRGIAVCQNDKDEFDPGRGIAIAWARYKGIPVPKCRASKLSELPIGAIFTFSCDGNDEYEYVGFSKTHRQCCAVLISTGQTYSISDQVVYY